jgi:Na+-transporting methylmalonyl-CoA/oxaloacetate decarboxylase gamma subunit
MGFVVGVLLLLAVYSRLFVEVVRLFVEALVRAQRERQDSSTDEEDL